MKKKTKYSIKKYFSGGDISGLISGLLGGFGGSNSSKGVQNFSINPNNIGNAGLPTVINSNITEKIEDPTTRYIVTGLTQGSASLLNLLNKEMDKKLQPNQGLLNEIQNISNIGQKGLKTKTNKDDEYLFEKVRGQYRDLIETPLIKEPNDRLYYRAKGIDPTKLDFNKAIDFGDYDFSFKDNPIAMSYAIAMKRSFPDMPNEVLEASIAGMLDDADRYKYFYKVGQGDVSKGYDIYNRIINTNKDKYEFLDMGSRNTLFKDGRLTALSEEDRRKRFAIYEPIEPIEVKPETSDLRYRTPNVNFPKPQFSGFKTPQEPEQKSETLQEPVLDRQRLPYTPYQIQKQYNSLQGLLSGIDLVRAHILGNDAFRRLQKLERPYDPILDIVKPAEKSTLENEKRVIDENVDKGLKVIKGNTGNLQSLISATQNIIGKGNEMKQKLMTEEENRFKNDYYNREFEKLREISLQNQLYNRHWKKEGYDKAERNLIDAVHSARAMKEQNLQKLQNILSESMQNKRMHSKQVYDAIRAYKSAKKDYIEQLKASNPSFFYKRDENGNIVMTSPEEQQSMLDKWEKDFDTGPGKEYAQLVNDVLNYGGKGFLGAFKRNKGYLPYNIETEKTKTNDTKNNIQQTDNLQQINNSSTSTISNQNTNNIQPVQDISYNTNNVYTNTDPRVLNKKNLQNTNNNLQKLFPHLFSNNISFYQNSGKIDLNDFKNIMSLLESFSDRKVSSENKSKPIVVPNNNYLDRLIQNIQKTDALMISQDNLFRQNIYDSIKRSTERARATFSKMFR